jgi:hypothetical protein
MYQDIGKPKGEFQFKGHQGSTNYISKSLHLNNQLPAIGRPWKWWVERVKVGK